MVGDVREIQAALRLWAERRTSGARARAAGCSSPSFPLHTHIYTHIHIYTQLGARQAGMPARAPPSGGEEEEEELLDLSRVLVTQKDGQDYQLRVYIPNSSSRETLRAIVKVPAMPSSHRSRY